LQQAWHATVDWRQSRDTPCADQGRAAVIAVFLQIDAASACFADQVAGESLSVNGEKEQG
jgi:hypothetical protein